MNPENSSFERLMDYLTHRMTGPDRIVFEAELARNPALRRALEEERALHEGIRTTVIRQKFSAIHNELVQDGTIQPPETIHPNQPESAQPELLISPVRNVRPLWSRLPVWQVAAGIALLATVGTGLYVWLMSSPTLSPAVSQRTPPPTIPAPKSTPNVSLEQQTPVAQNHPKSIAPAQIQKSPADEAYSYFRKLTAELSLDRQLAQLSTEEPTRSERSEFDELADGRQLLKTGDAKAAIAVLLPLANATTGDEWAESAQWYLAGAYLKAGQLAEGRALLKKIAETNNHTQQALATKLLKHTPKYPANHE